MKNFFLFSMLWIAGAAYCQTDAEFCEQAQSSFQQEQYNDAIKSAGRALAKNPGAPCRRVRINAALQLTEPSSVNYMMAISDIEYLMRNGDKAESTYKMLGTAEYGLANVHFDNQNFKEASKHYQKAQDAYSRAKGIGNSSDYDAMLADIDNKMKQANLRAK